MRTFDRRKGYATSQRLSLICKTGNPLGMQSSNVQKLMSLVTVSSEARAPMTFSELVNQTGLNKSSLHRLLSIATQEQLVQHVKGSKVYLLGPKVFDLVRNAYAGYDIQAVALDEMMRLHGLFDGNVTLGVPNGTDVVYLRLIEAKGALGGILRPGLREPVHCSASGMTLMSVLPRAVADAVLRDHEFERFTERTITNADTFRAALDHVRTQGFATNDREEYDHFVGISAPVFNYLGEPIAVLNIWTVHTRHSIDDITEWSGELVASAQTVTKMIGGQAPDLATLA